jgi:signal peptidase II
MPNGKKWMGWAIFFCLLDQASKFWIVSTIPLHMIRTWLPGVQFTHAANRGMAFSFLSDQPQWGTYLLTAAICVFCVVIARWLWKTPSTQCWEGMALALILGGAVGNVIDRFIYGHVIDFIDLYYGSFHWYTFNLADAFITVGALMFVKTILCSEGSCQTEKS